MILPRRPFKREPASREAKSIYIFCEGAKREHDYFKYFVELDSRINIIVYKLDPCEDNTPRGLIEIAEKNILGKGGNAPLHDFIEGYDEVWIVVDVDKDKRFTRKPQLKEAKEKCDKRKNWNLTISNPCFEVWLYYHLKTEKPDDLPKKAEDWKRLVNEIIPGGFDSRKHPLLLEKAKDNAMRNFSITGFLPVLGSTEVFKLANSMLPLIKDKLRKELNKIGELG